MGIVTVVMVVEMEVGVMVVVARLAEMAVVALDLDLEHLVLLLPQFIIQPLISFLPRMTITDGRG